MTKNVTRVTGVALVIVIVGALTGCSSMAQKGALSRAQKAYTKNDYARCVITLDRAATYGDYSQAVNAQVLFYKGLCLDGQERGAEAKVMYKKILKDYPDSASAAQAKARLGE